MSDDLTDIEGSDLFNLERDGQRAYRLIDKSIAALPDLRARQTRLREDIGRSNATRGLQVLIAGRYPDRNAPTVAKVAALQEANPAMFERILNAAEHFPKIAQWYWEDLVPELVYAVEPDAWVDFVKGCADDDQYEPHNPFVHDDTAELLEGDGVAAYAADLLCESVYNPKLHGRKMSDTQLKGAAALETAHLKARLEGVELEIKIVRDALAARQAQLSFCQTEARVTSNLGGSH